MVVDVVRLYTISVQFNQPLLVLFGLLHGMNCFLYVSFGFSLCSAFAYFAALIRVSEC